MNTGISGKLIGGRAKRRGHDFISVGARAFTRHDGLIAKSAAHALFGLKFFNISGALSTSSLNCFRVLQTRLDRALHFIKGLRRLTMVLRHTSGQKRVRSHFDGVGVALVFKHIKAIERFDHIGIQKLVFVVARNVFGLLNLQIKTFGNGLERFALFINHVGEGFGVFSKLTHSGLLLIKRFNFTAHLCQALCLRGFDVINANDVVAKLRFNRAH